MSKRSTTPRLRRALGGALAALLACAAPVAASPHPQTAPRIEAAFVLDTTGSMSGLIEGAKRKIWAIANEMASAEPTPDIRIGLLGYRDRGDSFVTRHFELTHDLDAIFGHLQSLDAGGGGDGPESVNQALHESLTRPGWSRDPGVYRVVFLVGDAPPHMDYQDDVPYGESVRQARERGIVVNAIQCGSWHETAEVWREIARLGEGSFAAIAQDGAMAAIETPHDAALAALAAEMSATVVPYGAPEERAEVASKLRRAAEAPAPASAERLSYFDKSGTAGVSGRKDLVEAVRGGEVDLDALDDAELPEPMREMDAPAREAYLAGRAARRDALQEKISALVKQRDAYVAGERARLAAEGKGDGFDRKVSEMIRSQAARLGIHYE